METNLITHYAVSCIDLDASKLSWKGGMLCTTQMAWPSGPQSPPPARDLQSTLCQGENLAGAALSYEKIRLAILGHPLT